MNWQVITVVHFFKFFRHGQLELRQQVQKLSALEQTLLDMQRTIDAIPSEIIASYKAESERKEPIAIE